MFRSEVHRLDWLIHEVEESVRRGDVHTPTPELLNVFVVTSLWLDTALTQAKAISLLIRQQLFPAVGPLQRALWELWTEWRYFLKQTDRPLNAAKVMLNARLEALELIEAQPGVFERGELARLQREVQEFESEHPQASAEIREQRKKRKFHWSGIGRSEMERAVAASAVVYKILSWDAHAVVGPIRDVSVGVIGDCVTFSFGRREDESDIERYAWISGGVLFYVYNDFARMWGLPAVVPPNAAT